ncbi:MAG: competence/damage-inducible protein A [Gemmatimonadota bacterium]
MNLEIVTIGTELLLGFTIDTNGAEIAQTLAAIGGRVTRRTSVPDRSEDIQDAVSAALKRTGRVITTGGLGPTRDDITKQCIAALLGRPLEFHDDIWQELVARYSRFGRIPSESNRSQAEVPRGAMVLPNPRGSAPGIWIEDPRGLVVMLPGVPGEMRGLMREEVAPRLAVRVSGSIIQSRTLRATGIPESSLAELLGDIEEAIAPITLAYLPGLDGVDLRLTAWDLAPVNAESQLATGAALIRERAGEHIYGEGEADLAAMVLDEARRRGSRLAVAESCTGGLVGSRLTAIPGASDVFVGGVIAYEDEVKMRELGVPAMDIQTHGAVSEAVVRRMVTGVAARFNADLAMAVTGIAGPTGGSEAKPVGLVWFGSLASGHVLAQQHVFPGPRENVRARSAQAVLFQLYKRLLKGG